MRFLLCAFLLFCITGVEAVIKRATVDIGPVSVVFIFNNETIATSKVVFSGYDSSINTAYFQTVVDTSNADTHVCRISSQQRIIWGPNGCSDTNNPQNALQSANCLGNEVDVELRQNILAGTWYRSKESDDCFLGGGDGEIRLCPGPLRLARDNMDSFLPYPAYTARNLLSSRMQFLDCLVGPYAMSPCVVRIQMSMPAMWATTGCVDNVTNLSYEGNYSNIETDAYRFMITDVWKDFKASNQWHRLMLKRIDQFSTSFQIVLGNTIAVDGGFTYVYKSADVISTVQDTQRIFLDWVNSIEFGIVYPMYHYVNGSFACNLTLTIPDEIEYNLIAPYPVNQFNYSYNINPRVYYKTSVCNVCFGRLDVNGNLVCPDCPEGDVCGGSVRYVYPGDIDLAVYVPPNPNLHYRLNCDEFYPKSEVFLDFNNVESPRISIQEQQCFSPYLSNSLIELGYTPDEKFTQCQKLGGYTWGRAQVMCAKPITSLECQEGWIYFDQRCFYKFSPFTETRFSVPIDQADTSCTNLNPASQPLVEIDVYTDIWLLNYFLFYKRNINVFAGYRVPIFGAVTCNCYTTQTYASVQCPCYNIELEENVNIFPICFYFISEAALEPEYADIGVSLQTATLWKHGQVGPQPSGLEALCECFDGWTGKNCERATCPLSTIITENPSDANELTTFFRKCYNKGRGACYNGQSRVCQCNFPYGPSASILPNLDYLYTFREFPCACPAVPRVNGTFEINGIVYAGSVLYLPCGGIDQGSCFVQNNTNIGTCACEVRPNLVFGGIDSAYDGKACSCPTPIQPWQADVKNGIIVTEFCNHRGTCCPFGQTIDNPDAGDLYASACFEPVTGDPIEGCSCDNGYGGPSCTCPTPYDVCEGLGIQKLKDEDIYYIDMISQYFVTVVRTVGCGNPGLTVSISNEVGRPDQTISCVYNETMLFWDCLPNRAYQFVVVSGITTFVSGCTFQAYETFFQYCGANETVNPFAGRFFDIPAYRGVDTNLVQQYANIANFGCTNTECMCNSDYGGKLCALAVSSIREVEVVRDSVPSLLQSKMYCGETVLVPNLENPVRGRGQMSDEFFNCSCNSISNVDNTGRTGRTAELFSGRACQCADVYNRDQDQILTCAGHGTCIEPSFPYGRCSVDLEKYEGDALFHPFISSSSFVGTVNRYTAAEDSFFITYSTKPSQAPTLLPTGAPTTEGPSASPTKSPTTKSPTTASPTTKSPTTKSPTTASPTTQSPTKTPTTGTPTTQAPNISKLILFGRPTPGPAVLGSISTTNANCVTQASINGLVCRNSVSLLQYSTRAFADFPRLYGFPTNVPVVGPTNIDIGTWVNTQDITTTLSSSLVGAGVVPSLSPTYWTGTPIASCVDWTSTSSFDGANGFGTSTSSTWINAAAICSGTNTQFVCACIQGTAIPTSNPTSPSPSPGKILIYRTPSIYPGSIGSISTTNAICAVTTAGYGATCASSVSMLQYTTRSFSAFPGLYGFAPTSVMVSGPSGVEIGPWAATSSPSSLPILTTMVTSGVIPAVIPVSYWTGTPTSNCGDWTLTTSTPTALGLGQFSDTRWIFSSSAGGCSLGTLPFLCACVQSSTSPTKNPTKAPTRTPTVAPTTLSPTAPTKAPTPTTSRIRIIPGPLVFGLIDPDGNPEDLDAACTNLYTVNYACRKSAAFLQFLSPTTPHLFSSFPGLYGFPTSAPLIGPTGITIAPSWSSAFSSGLTNSLFVAGVTPFPDYWTGYTSTPSTSTDCSQWTSTAGTGRIGSSTSTSTSWLNSGTASCSTFRPYLCLCIQGSATPTTLSPTTKFPTSTPTNAPSSKSPTITPTTATPTTSPTRSPTQSPTIFENLRVMYRLPEGSITSVENNYKDITYSHLHTVPTNLTLSLITGSYEPIYWTDYTYRVYNPVTDLTTTETLTSCNPGEVPPIPGTPELQFDGVYSCPTIEACILTTDCTDDLAPSGTYEDWPDLRACVCSYTVDDYPGKGPIATLDPLTLQIFSGNLTVDPSSVPPADNIGTIQCNNFIEREINCQLFRANPFYIFQCAQEPIGCYDQTLGRFFGGFYNQNPGFQYPLNYSIWTEGQYRGIASLLNNLVYSRNGMLVDPFSSTLWNDYTFLNISDIEIFTSGDMDADISSYQAYLQQSDPHIYSLNSVPRPVIDKGKSRTLDPVQKACIDNIVATGGIPNSDNLCYDVTWNNSAYNGISLHRAGVEYTFSYPAIHNLLSVAVTMSTSTLGDITGVEVYDTYGNPCGSVYNSEGMPVDGERLYFVCDDTERVITQYPGEFQITIRLMGLNSIYDMPGSTLNSDYIGNSYNTDPLRPYLQSNLYTKYLQSTWPLCLAWAYDMSPTIPSNQWPQRLHMSSPPLYPVAPFSVTYNYTLLAENATSTALFSEAFAELAAAILTNNTYPENLPLRLIEATFFTVPINYSDPDHLAYLQDIWEVWLAPRYCGADEVQCQTFQLGECVITSDIKQRWYNIGEFATYEFEGEEGGCFCHNTFPLGFYDFTLFCQQCVQGYGPSNMDNFAQVIESNSLLTQVLPTGFITFTSLTAAQFEESYACRFPFGFDPVVSPYVDYNACAGHGVFSYYSNLTSAEFIVWPTSSIIACTGLSTENSTFYLSPDTTSEFNLMYINEYDEILNVIGDLRSAAVYMGLGSVCSLTCTDEPTFPVPWSCVLTCSDGMLPTRTVVTCVNELLFFPEDISIRYMSYYQNRFLLRYE